MENISSNQIYVETKMTIVKSYKTFHSTLKALNHLEQSKDPNLIKLPNHFYNYR